MSAHRLFQPWLFPSLCTLYCSAKLSRGQEQAMKWNISLLYLQSKICIYQTRLTGTELGIYSTHRWKEGVGCQKAARANTGGIPKPIRHTITTK